MKTGEGKNHLLRRGLPPTVEREYREGTGERLPGEKKEICPIEEGVGGLPLRLGGGKKGSNYGSQEEENLFSSQPWAGGERNVKGEKLEKMLGWEECF